MAPRVQVLAFDHLVLRCADVERSLGFYVDQLGLGAERVDAWRRGDVPFPSVRISADTIIDLLAGSGSGDNVDHFCLVIEPTDLDELQAAFPGSRRADNLSGARGLASSLYVLDPDGNSVELRSYPD